MASIDNILIVAGVLGLAMTYLSIVHFFIAKAEQPESGARQGRIDVASPGVDPASEVEQFGLVVQRR